MRVTPAEIERMRQLAASGSTLGDAAKALGRPYCTVFVWARKLGIAYADGYNRVDGERTVVIAKRYAAGETLQSIANDFGITRERIRQIIRDHTGLKPKDGGIAVVARERAAAKAAAEDARHIEEFGCTAAQMRHIRLIGKRMRAAGSGYFQTPLNAFRHQRHNAQRRGIGWELNFWQWWTIWQRSGKWEQRGRGQGYVMCRRGDSGPYAEWNVFIATAAENSSKQGKKKSGLPTGVRQSGKATFVAMRMVAGQKLKAGPFPTPEQAYSAYVSLRAA